MTENDSETPIEVTRGEKTTAQDIIEKQVKANLQQKANQNHPSAFNPARNVQIKRKDSTDSDDTQDETTELVVEYPFLALLSVGTVIVAVTWFLLGEYILTVLTGVLFGFATVQLVRVRVRETTDTQTDYVAELQQSYVDGEITEEQLEQRLERHESELMERIAIDDE